MGARTRQNKVGVATVARLRAKTSGVIGAILFLIGLAWVDLVVRLMIGLLKF
jgi:hypothetical protein